jgi:hypothetical protein
VLLRSRKLHPIAAIALCGGAELLLRAAGLV